MYVLVLFIFKFQHRILYAQYIFVYSQICYLFFIQILDISQIIVFSCQQTEEKNTSGTRCFLDEKYNNSLWKESLNSNGEQFHQYQQNKQSPFTLTHWTYKRPRHMMEIQVLAWDRHKHVAGLNQLMGFQTFRFDNWVSSLLVQDPRCRLFS